MSLPTANERRGSADRILDDPGSFGRSDASSIYSEKTIIDARRSMMGAHSPTPSEVIESGASKFELFYDLWFVANLNTFTSVHEITDEDTLYSFVGYILLLWTTWFLTTIFDVRFGVDGIIQRITRGAHLAVMIGFAEAGSTFNPNAQVQGVFQAMSLFLMVSRLTLALQYIIVCFRGHERIERKKAVLFTAGFHLIFAVTYLGVSFYTTRNPKSNVFTFWYYAAIVELAIHVIHARFSMTLSFLGTHLTERLNLLTLIILGEGIIIITKKVAVLVENTWIKGSQTNWSPALIGTITSAAALVYIIFQLYFDWLHEDGGSCLTTHCLWVVLHLPFHIALVLLLEGGNQFIVWRRAIEAIGSAASTLEDAAVGFQGIFDTGEIVGKVRWLVVGLLRSYEPSNQIETWKQVNETFDDMEGIPNYFWEVYPQLSEQHPIKKRWLDDISKLVSAVFNGINNAFEISDDDDKLVAHTAGTEFSTSVKVNTYGAFQDDFGFRSVEADAYIATMVKFRVVYFYVFVCAGLVLAFLVALHLLSRRHRWSHLHTFRTTFTLMIAVGLSLTSLVGLNIDEVTKALMSPWQLPVITISYFMALVLTHVRHPSRVFTIKMPGTWLELDEPKEKEKDSSSFV